MNARMDGGAQTPVATAAGEGAEAVGEGARGSAQNRQLPLRVIANLGVGPDGRHRGEVLVEVWSTDHVEVSFREAPDTRLRWVPVETLWQGSVAVEAMT